MRLDKKIVELGLVPTRSKAQDLIRRGQVSVNGQTVTKPSYDVKPEDKVELTAGKLYVSRAAHKLLAALQGFDLDVQGKTCLDIGSSTGGFTQVLLERGARKVYAVDTGTEQMHPSLRSHPALVLLEQTDARRLTRDLIPETIDFFVADVSFISVTAILPQITHLLSPKAQGVILIKPQFELEPALVSKGIVRKKQLHIAALEKVTDKLAQAGFLCKGLLPSPIKGGKGNIEFLAYYIYNGVKQPPCPRPVIEKTVEQAHGTG